MNSPIYAQSWKHCINLSKHMWRFYIQHPSATIAQMTNASYNAWSACNTVYHRLNPEEQNIVRIYFTTPWGDRNDIKAVEQYATDNGVTTEYVWDIIDKAYRLVAIERGVADPYVPEVGKISQQILPSGMKQNGH